MCMCMCCVFGACARIACRRSSEAKKIKTRTQDARAVEGKRKTQKESKEQRLDVHETTSVTNTKSKASHVDLVMRKGEVDASTIYAQRQRRKTAFLCRRTSAASAPALR